MKNRTSNISLHIPMRTVLTVLFCALISAFMSIDSLAQDYKAKQSLREGNSHYKAGEYDKALTSYQLANRYDSTYAKAAFNHANTLYQEGKVEEAEELYKEASNLFTDNKDKSRAHHNIGRSHLQRALGKLQTIAANGGLPQDQSQDPRPDLEASLNEFKESLLLDPLDEEARYNYGYARKLLNQLPPSNEEQQQDDGEEGEDQEQEQNPKDQNEQDKENGEDEKKDESEPKEDQEKGEEEKKEQPEPQQQDPNRMSAEQQLDLLDQEEKELQKEMSKKRLEGSPIRVEKDW